MKKTIPIFILFFVISIHFLSAQEDEKCYEIFREYGLTRFKNSQYKKAIYNFQAANQCPDKPQSEHVNSLIERAKKCFEFKAKAKDLYKQRKYKEAKVYYDKIASLNPDDAICKDRLNKCKAYLNPDTETNNYQTNNANTKNSNKNKPKRTKKIRAIPTSLGITFIHVQGGTFSMGSKDYVDEKPIHEVRLNDFYISKQEITNQQYANFLNSYGTTRSKDGKYSNEALIHLKGQYEDLKCRIFYDDKEKTFKVEKGFEDHPANYVSWYGAYYFAHFYGYRLATEAEWEYAAKGGAQSKAYKFSGSNDAEEVAWYKASNKKESMTHEVATKKPNELGIYDMSGNVWEWCSDWYDYTYKESTSDNPKGAEVGTHKVLRGGSWGFNSNYLRTSNRLKNIPETESAIIGFRVVNDVKK